MMKGPVIRWIALFTNYPQRVIIRQWKNLTIDHKSG